MSRAARDTLEIRAFRPEDEATVLQLLVASLGTGPAGARPPEFFRWKHYENHFGPSLMLVAIQQEAIVGLRAFMRWRFRAGDRTFSAVRAVDTATHPDFQGQGIFKTLTLEAIDRLRQEVDLIFNTPNDKSLPGYLKMGWQSVGQMDVLLKIRHPVAFIRARAGSIATEPLSPRPEIRAHPAVAILEATKTSLGPLLKRSHAAERLCTDSDVAYLQWRYGAAPLLDYRALTHNAGEELAGIAIFRIRPRGALWEATVSELITRPGDTTTVRRLLRDVARSADVDHLTYRAPEGASSLQAARLGLLRSPRGMTFVTNRLRDGLHPDPSALSSWALSLGDLEVF